ncbi:NAD-P-binding protein [Daedaleopsis nitida]|nr:NAD-P-binding protein [Daedaleopsis nitida]
MSSEKRVVLVTGCSKGGIGFALCEAFATKGCIVYATARKVESMGELTHGNIRKLALDVTNDDNVQEAVRTVIEADGQIDVLVNNAGISSSGALIDIDMSEIMQLYDTNVFSVIRMAKAVIPHMAARKRGTIVNIGSIGGEIPVPWGGPYCSSKAAVHSITDTLYMECTPLNIDVVLVSPGGVKSNIAANQTPRVSLPQGSLYSDYAEAIIKKLNSSQTNSPVPTDAFAEKVVGAVLQRRPPRYMTLGRMSTIYQFFHWLPRASVLRLIWGRYSQVPQKRN